MTALAHPLQLLWNAQDEPNGVGPESQKLSRIRSDIGEHLTRNITVGADLADRQDELFSVFEECSDSDWDAYGAIALSPEAFEETQWFLRRIPLGIAMPEIVPEPDGDIGLLWTGTGGKTFVVSFDGTSMVTFAGLLGGGNKIHGTSRFISSIPKNILDILVQHFPRRKSKTRSA